MKFEQIDDKGLIDGKFFVGTRFYRWPEGQEKPETIRLIGYKKETPAKGKRLVFLNSDRKRIISQVDTFMKSDWKVLANDGFIMVTRVVDDKNRDIDVAVVARTKDDSNKIAVCRQSCIDMYKMSICPDTVKPALGMSTSYDKYPGNFEDMLKFPEGSSLVDNKVYAVYNDDTFKDIMGIIETSVYDRALKSIKRRLEAPNTEFPNGASGCASSLEELLDVKFFMYDFYSLFDISYHPNVLLQPGTSSIIPKSIADEIAMLVPSNKKIINVYTMQYDKTVDLSKIMRDYIMVANHNAVYIIGIDSADLENL